MRLNWVVLRQSFMNSIAYGPNSFIWMMIAMVEVIVPMAIWYTATPLSSTIGGFTKPEILAYYALMALIGNLTFWWLHFDVEEDIRSGDLSNLLIKPISYFRYRILYQLSDKFFNLIMRLPIVMGIIVLFGGAVLEVFNPALAPVLLASIISGALIYMLISLNFGMLSFWLTSSTGLMSLYYFSSYLLSGELAPLSVYPAWFQFLTHLLPYRYVLSFPIEIILGKLNSNEIVFGLVVQGVWLLLLYLLLKRLWTKGTYQYQAYGK